MVTFYAPAERSNQQTIAQQNEFFNEFALIDPLLSGILESVVILNDHRQIVYANQNFLDFLKVTQPEAILGLRLGEALQCAHAFTMEGGCGTSQFCAVCGAAKAIAQAQKGKKTLNECRISLNKAEIHEALDLRVWATRLNFEDEKFTLFSIVDISSEKRRRILERVFFHDIINTASAIQGLTEMLETDDHLGMLPLDEVQALLKQASVQLIDEIKAQSQISAAEQGDLTVDPQLLATVPFLMDLIGVYKHHEIAAGRFLQLDPQAEDLLIQSDKTLLGRVVANMIKNALEASIPGESVTLGCECAYDRLRISVHNPAVIPHHVQLQIFQRSFSTKGQDRGLGTYSMKLLAENYLHGKVQFTSTPETGTKFMVTLPVIWER
ncbi:MAG: GHKL domain-containing protein [Anaerolineaceae bacterium]|nr:GHKL domain-containing protein [Anaerolineaceae bacterium]